MGEEVTRRHVGHSVERTKTMSEREGVIKHFYTDKCQVVIGNIVYNCNESLFENIHKNFLVGDSVKFEIFSFDYSVKNMVLTYRKSGV